MTKQKESFSDKVFRFSIPHVLVLILLIILFCCGLTYILPAGLYEIDPQTGLVVPNSFHWVENSPISPWRALVEVTNGVASQGVIFALLFIMGGLIYVVIESGAINNVINYSVYKLQDKSITVLVPAIVVLMSAIGALAGQDSLVTFVLVGLLLVKKLVYLLFVLYHGSSRRSDGCHYFDGSRDRRPCSYFRFGCPFSCLGSFDASLCDLHDSLLIKDQQRSLSQYFGLC